MKSIRNTNWLLLLMGAPLFAFAQQTNEVGSTYFSNALFNTLLVIIILLLILVLTLSNTIRNIIQSDYFKERYKKMRENQSGKSMAVIFFLFLASKVHAQTAQVQDEGIGGIDQLTFYFYLV